MPNDVLQFRSQTRQEMDGGGPTGRLTPMSIRLLQNATIFRLSEKLLGRPATLEQCFRTEAEFTCRSCERSRLPVG